MFSAISTMEFEEAQVLQGEFIQMLSSICSFDAEHVMKLEVLLSVASMSIARIGVTIIPFSCRL